MYKDVYIGLAHDKAFDFDKEGNWNGYMPTLLYGKNVPYEYFGECKLNCVNLQ